VWPELRQRSCGFGKGIAPQVASNGSVAIEVHASSHPFDTTLYSTSSAILDRPSWLDADRDEPRGTVLRRRTSPGKRGTAYLRPDDAAAEYGDAAEYGRLVARR
jgi:hypothetical protein